MGKFMRYCKINEEHYGDNAFDVSRPNILGNPYTHIKDKKTKALKVVKDRDEAIDAYSYYFDEAYKKNEDFRNEVDKLYEAYQKYDIVYLGCYCPTNMRCHCDVIIQKMSLRAMREKMKEIIERRKSEE